MDEEQIEATIRRVAEAKAALEGGAPAPEAATAPRSEALPASAALAPHAEESAIEATIRRVAEAQAVRAAEATAVAPPEQSPSEHAAESEGRSGSHEAATEDAIRRVHAARSGMTDHAPPSEPPLDIEPQAARAAVEESAIEAAIRRVAEAKAEREREAATVEVEPAMVETPRLVPLHPAPAAWHAPVTEPDDRGESELAQAVAQLRQELDETKRALDALTARFEAAAPAGAIPSMPASSDGRDEWYDPPSVPRAATPLARDGGSQGAAGDRAAPHDDVERVIDTRPIPKPLPPLRAEPKRGLDLLPRTYRITVEDKRRGVDLVPLHRALLGMDGVRDMSLLSYSNGVAIVSLDVVDELNPETLGRAVSRAMSREAKVEVHNEQTMVVKLAEE
jgi:hypothetical protein